MTLPVDSASTAGSSQGFLEDARPWAWAVALPLVVGLLVVATLQFFPSSFARAAFPWPENLWPETPLMLQLHRMAIGDHAYRSSLEVNSFVYGPVYLTTLHWIRSLFHLPFTVVTLRAISITISYLTVIPVAVSALLIARRGGVRTDQVIPMTLVVGTAVLAGVAVIMRNLTFDALHPDALSFLLTMTALAVYYAIVSGRLSPRYVWLLLAVCVLDSFTKQNAALIFLFLLWALVALGLLKFRIGMLASTIYVVAIVAGFLIGSQAERQWTLLIPGSQGYDFGPVHTIGLWMVVTTWLPYLGVMFVGTIVAMVLLRANDGNRSIIIDAAPFAGILVTALSGYFKVFGVWNNISLIALFGAPYYALFVGLLWMPVERMRQWTVGLACAVFAVATPLGMFIQTRQPPDGRMSADFTAIQSYADQLCAQHQSMIVTIFPEFFFDCPTAKFALFVDYGQLTTAFPHYFIGPTVVDLPPTEKYIVSSSFVWMDSARPSWYDGYHVIKRLPAFFGYGSSVYWGTHLVVWERNPPKVKVHHVIVVPPATTKSALTPAATPLVTPAAHVP